MDTSLLGERLKITNAIALHRAYVFKSDRTRKMCASRLNHGSVVIVRFHDVRISMHRTHKKSPAVGSSMIPGQKKSHGEIEAGQPKFLDNDWQVHDGY